MKNGRTGEKSIWVDVLGQAEVHMHVCTFPFFPGFLIPDPTIFPECWRTKKSIGPVARQAPQTSPRSNKKRRTLSCTQSWAGDAPGKTSTDSRWGMQKHVAAKKCGKKSREPSDDWTEFCTWLSLWAVFFSLAPIGQDPDACLCWTNRTPQQIRTRCNCFIPFEINWEL